MDDTPWLWITNVLRPQGRFGLRWHASGFFNRRYEQCNVFSQYASGTAAVRRTDAGRELDHIENGVSDAA